MKNTSNPTLTLTLTALAASIAAVFPATSHGAEGRYVEFGAGVNFPRDHNTWANGAPVGINTYDEGGLATLAFGSHLREGYRADLELGFRRNVADSVGATAGHGSVNAESVMANLWFDWPVAPVRPYAGAGVGAVMIDARHLSGAGAGDRSDSDVVFAYQAGLGLAYDVAPHLALSLGYRWINTDEGSFGPGPVEMDYQADAWLATLRYSFGRGSTVAAAEPAPQPQAEVAAFETIVLRPVNFRFDDASLTEPAQQTLDEIAGALRNQPGVRVTIEGHADAIGDPQYNRDLGLKRATAVRDYLARKGVDPATLEVRSMGENQPVADNRSEEGRATNRRAEFEAGQAPANVRIVIEGPTPESKEAAQ